MTALRIVSLVLALTAVLTLGVGTLGFSDVSADREVSAAVVGDDSAYVGYETSDITAVAGEEIDLVTITNRFASTEPITVAEVDVDVSGASGVSIGSISRPLIDLGTSSPIAATLEQCSPGTEPTVEVSVEVVGDGVSAEVDGDTATREFKLACEAPEPEVTGVRFDGEGTVKVTASPDGMIPKDEVTVWALDDGNVSVQSLSDDLQTNKSLKSQLDPSNDRTIIALEFENSAYVHPQLEEGEITTPRNEKKGIEVSADVDREYLASFSASEESD